MPGAFKIAADIVTIGRTPEKADVVIAVPTVSGLHARIQRSEETLRITDLDSTNGTFIGDKRLPPGIASAGITRRSDHIWGYKLGHIQIE